MKNAPGFLLLLLTTYQAWAFEYPNVWRNESVVDDYFGTKVIDAYRWLEDVNLEETKTFVKEQNKLTDDYIKSNPNWNKVRKSFEELYDYDRFGIPVKHGDKYYVSMTTSHLQNQAVLYSLKTLDDKDPQVFIDPNGFSEDGTSSLAFTTFSDDAKYCVYGISKGGSDWISFKVRDVETKKDLSETLTKIKFAHVGWNTNNKGFFYAYYDKYDGTGEGTDTEIPQFQKLYYHNLNTEQSKDIEIYGFPEHPYWLIGTPVISETGNFVHIFPTEGTSNTPWLFAKFDPENISKLKFEWIVDEPDAEYYYVGTDEKCVYVRTNYLAENFRLVCVDLNNFAPSNWKDILPANKKAVLTNSLMVNKNYLVVIYMLDVVDVVQIHDLNTGKHLFDVDTPIGTISSIYGSAKDTEFFYKFSTFLSPGIIYRYDFSASPNQVEVYKESSVANLNTQEFVTDQVFYPSKDGTMVPMFMVHRRNLQKNNKNPTMLYAYGGFNINIQPEYNALGIFFAKNLNGIYAVANIRGGGEYGDVWHKQGMRHNKQNVFDDFAAAGEYLIKNNYTAKNYLTINGRSNGGLLVGTSSNQRPDIFGASLANVGVMDMLRFKLFTIGYAWVEEYGDPIINKEDFNTIYKYSPLHNIHTEMDSYPNMLVLTADHDDRVVPAHSYKFIAELQYRLAAKLKDTPLMIRIDSDSGHGSGKPTSKWIDEYTDIICFLLNTLKYPLHA